MRNSRRPADDGVLRTLKDIERSLPDALTRTSALGYEGTAARLYFGVFASILRPEADPFGRRFEAERRKRRPPRDRSTVC